MQARGLIGQQKDHIYIHTRLVLQNVCSFCSSSSSSSSSLRHIKGDLPRLYTRCSPCSGGGFRRSGRCCHRRHACQSDRSSRSPRSKNSNNSKCRRHRVFSSLTYLGWYASDEVEAEAQRSQRLLLHVFQHRDG